MLAEHWPLIEADLAQFSGIDCGDPNLMASRSWRWLRTHIEGLLALPPAVVVYPSGHVQSVPQTRLGCALNPPQPVET